MATKPYKELRYPAVSPMTPDPMTGSYLAIYWVLKGHHDEWNRWSVDQVKNLHATGRMFAERTHIHTVLYEKQWSAQRTEWGTPAELALDRGYQGLVVNVGELAEGVTHDQIEEWTRSTWGGSAFSARGGGRSRRRRHAAAAAADAPPDVPRVENADRRFLQLHFLDHDPAEGWDEGYGRFGTELEASGLARTCGPHRSSRPCSARTPTPTSCAEETTMTDAASNDIAPITGPASSSPA